MSPLLRSLRRGAALAALAGLLGQSILPAAHSWHVGTEEAHYHASVHAAPSDARLCNDHQHGHHHHSDADCPLCPLFSSVRLAAVHGACAAGAPSGTLSLPGVASGPRSSADVPGAPVRGPPAVLSV
ncbi:MAG: hypothetical protein FD126_1607 [Elusimicrobia bacterium]|nr:MAG: hypothetical protein FD126_1607 [Elusimicrobiota bacterium]